MKDLSQSLAVSHAAAVQSVKGYTGAGVGVAIWEDSPEPVTDFKFEGYFDPSRQFKSRHARMVAAIVKNKHPSEPNGYAPVHALLGQQAESGGARMGGGAAEVHRDQPERLGFLVGQ